jgi:hypothetical protein
MKIGFIFVSILLCCLSSAIAQDTVRVDTTVKYDTILYVPSGFESSTIGVVDTVNYEKRLYQNPTVALFKSMFVPGLGQIGNRQYIKAGIVIGLETWFITSAVKHGRDASDFRDQFNQSSDINERNVLYNSYLDSKDQRNKFTWFAVIVTFISMFDAYSDAHLSGFPKDEEDRANDLGFDLRSTEENGFYATVTYSF